MLFIQTDHAPDQQAGQGDGNADDGYFSKIIADCISCAFIDTIPCTVEKGTVCQNNCNQTSTQDMLFSCRSKFFNAEISLSISSASIQVVSSASDGYSPFVSGIPV